MTMIPKKKTTRRHKSVFVTMRPAGYERDVPDVPKPAHSALTMREMFGGVCV